MTETTKKCYLCKKLYRYYTKGVDRYNKTDCGFCIAHARIVNIHDGCEQYAIRNKRRLNKTVLFRRVSELLTQISEIRRILESENDEAAE